MALAAAGLSLVTPGLQGPALAPAGQAVMRGVARAVLAQALPAGDRARDAALRGHLERVDATVAGLPPNMQRELGQLLTLLAHPAGRMALTGLGTAWPDASADRIGVALQGMRTSSVALRQQAYHALRDITNASYFAAPDTWAALGYPGPRAL